MEIEESSMLDFNDQGQQASGRQNPEAFEETAIKMAISVKIVSKIAPALL